MILRVTTGAEQRKRDFENPENPQTSRFVAVGSLPGIQKDPGHLVHAMGSFVRAKADFVRAERRFVQSVSANLHGDESRSLWGFL